MTHRLQIEDLRKAALEHFHSVGCDPQCIKGHHKRVGKSEDPQIMFTLLIRDPKKRERLTKYLLNQPYQGEFYSGSLRDYHEWSARNSRVVGEIAIPQDPDYQVYALTGREGTAKEKEEILRNDLEKMVVAVGVLAHKQNA